MFCPWWLVGQRFWRIFFKLEEEGKPSLLLLLPALYAESAVFEYALWTGCWLVVWIAQAVLAKYLLSDIF
jgi:hypothetical protein